MALNGRSLYYMVIFLLRGTGWFIVKTHDPGIFEGGWVKRIYNVQYQCLKPGVCFYFPHMLIMIIFYVECSMCMWSVHICVNAPQPPPKPNLCSLVPTFFLKIVILLCGYILLPPANEVWSKVIFLHLFVILFTGGLPQCMLGCHPPGPGTPPA